MVSVIMNMGEKKDRKRKSKETNGFHNNKKNTSTKKVKNEKDNLIIEVCFKKGISVEVDDSVYSSDDIKEITRIVNHMSKHIYIDKTYVIFKENRWNDAFIKEDGWNQILSTLKKTNYGKNATKKQDDLITTSLMCITLAYLSNILEHMGYDTEFINISISEKSIFQSSYYYDGRTDFRF